MAQQLTDGRAYLGGRTPSLANAAGYYNFWFVRTFCPGFADRFGNIPNFDAWYDRVSAIGHEGRAAMTLTDALEVARNAKPEVIHTLPADAAMIGMSTYMQWADIMNWACGTITGSALVF